MNRIKALCLKEQNTGRILRLARIFEQELKMLIILISSGPRVIKLVKVPPEQGLNRTELPAGWQINLFNLFN